MSAVGNRVATSHPSHDITIDQMPPFQTLDELRQKLDASILAVTAWTMLVLTGGGVLLFGLLGITPGVSEEARAIRMLVGSVLAIISAATLLLLKRGYVRLAAGIFIATIYVVLVGGAVWLQLGVHSVALPLMACMILIAGFMIGRRAGLAVAILSMANATNQQILCKRPIEDR